MTTSDPQRDRQGRSLGMFGATMGPIAVYLGAALVNRDGLDARGHRPERGGAIRIGHAASTVVGESLYVDFAYLPWVMRLREVYGVTLPDRIEGWLEALCARPAVATVMRTAGPVRTR